MVAIVLAYLLEWPTVRLQSIAVPAAGRRRLYWWFSSVYCYDGVRGSAYCLAAGHLLNPRLPGMLNKLSDFAATLPRRYPR